MWIDKDKKIIYVYLSTSEGQRSTAVLSGVHTLRADDFRGGNIILDVSTRGPDEIRFADISELFDLQPDHEQASWERQLLTKINDLQLQLLEINPSYGGGCLILAREIEFLDGKH